MTASRMVVTKCHPEVSSFEEGHHNMLCHPLRGHRLCRHPAGSSFEEGHHNVLCHRLRRHPLGGHHTKCVYL